MVMLTIPMVETAAFSESKVSAGGYGTVRKIGEMRKMITDISACTYIQTHLSNHINSLTILRSEIISLGGW